MLCPDWRKQTCLGLALGEVSGNHLQVPAQNHMAKPKLEEQCTIASREKEALGLVYLSPTRKPELGCGQREEQRPVVNCFCFIVSVEFKNH